MVENVNTIDSFFDMYRFLSNFYGCQVWVDVYMFPSVENAYQFSKLPVENRTPEMVSYFQQCTPSESKRFGRNIPIRSDWSTIKKSVMEELLRQKFADPLLKQMLLDTLPCRLVEGNWWGDRYWGVCNGVGSNHLGKLLMKIREELSKTKLADIF